MPDHYGSLSTYVSQIRRNLDTLEGRRLCDWLAQINKFLICIPPPPQHGSRDRSGWVPKLSVLFRNCLCIMTNKMQMSVVNYKKPPNHIDSLCH